MFGGLAPILAESPSAASKPAPAFELVPGKDVPHWSGLPLLRAEAEALGFEMPLPLGVSATFYTEQQSFHMPQLKLGPQGGKLFDAGGLVRVPEVKTSQSAETIRVDAWVLPFLNLYAVAGYVHGHADVKIQPAIIPPPWSPKFSLRLDYEGPTVGLGGTLATGFRPFSERPTIFFGLADLNVTQTFLDFRQVVSSLQPVTVAVVNMRCGVRERILQASSLGDIYMSLWGGIMWEGVQEVMSGDLSILDLSFRGKVRAFNPVNTIVGSRLEIGKHLDVMVDVGLGERKSLMLSAGWRF